MEQMEIAKARQQVTEAGKQLAETGLIARTWGNVSCRVNQDLFVITPSGKEYHTLKEEDMVTVNLKTLQGEKGKVPSSEKALHGELYKLRRDVNFIIHTHQENASVLSSIGFDIIRLDENYEGLYDEVICADYALPGSAKLCKNVIKAVKLSPGKAVIMKNHGALCYGTDYEEAFAVAQTLEIASMRYIEKKRNKFGDLKAYEDHSPEISQQKLHQIQSEYETHKQIVWNQDPEVVRVSALVPVLRPYIDDFAQIVGTKINAVLPKDTGAAFIPGQGAVCIANTRGDAEAISVIVRKNCKAFLGATLFKKPDPINPLDCYLMRFNYLKKYSKMRDR